MMLKLNLGTINISMVLLHGGSSDGEIVAKHLSNIFEITARGFVLPGP
jgi:hypothetical protein